MNRQLMEYVMFGRINPMRDLQTAADDVGVIAETVETLGKLLDRFYANHGGALYQELLTAWPTAADIGGCSKPIYELERRLTPPED